MHTLHRYASLSRTHFTSASTPILHYSFPALLPSGDLLTIHPDLGILSRITHTETGPHLLQQLLFTSSEIHTLIPIFDAFPHYCPYETLFAYFYNRTTDEETVTSSRHFLHQAQEDGIMDQVMRPVRNTLSRARLKLRPFGLDISALLATGYLLIPRKGET